MKFRILAAVAVAAVMSLSAAAQKPAWTLDSCIAYAVDHNLNVRSGMIRQAGGELDIIEAKDRFLPTVSAGAAQNWDFGRGLTSENTYANRNTSMSSFNGNLSLPIFQGLSAIRQLKYARENLRQLVEETEAAKDDVTLNVIAQYLQVLYSKELHDVAVEQVRLSKVELERQEVLLEQGKIPELDVVQSRAQVAKDELGVVTSHNDWQLALVDLARLLELDDIEGFDIAPIADGDERGIFSPDEVYSNAMSSNHSILAARQGIVVADKAIDVARSGYLPRLNFSAGLGSSFYKVSGLDNASFSRQMRDNFSKSLGFSLSVPIFDAFSTRNQIRRAKVQRVTAELELEQRRSALYKDIRQAYYQAVAAERKFSASTVATEATHAALDAVTEKFNYGKANATEFEQAKSEYVKSRAELVQAKYEMILRNRILAFYNHGSFI